MTTVEVRLLGSCSLRAGIEMRLMDSWNAGKLILLFPRLCTDTLGPTVTRQIAI